MRILATDGINTDTAISGISKLFEDYGNISDNTLLRNFMGSTDTPDFSTTPPSDFESWISNNSYNALLSKLNVDSDFPTPFIDVDLSYTILRLFLENDGNFEIPDLYILEEGFITNSSKFEGNFSFEVLDENDNIISNISFEPNFIITTENGTDIDIDRTFIIFALPLNNRTPSKIVFKNLTSTIAEVNRTISTPSLPPIFPIGGETISQQTTISYDATDADSDTINYAILISSDNGATFSTLAIDYPNKTFFLNITPFPDGNQYKIKVLATDGINTDYNLNGGEVL